MAKGGYRPGSGRPPQLNPDGSRKHKVRVRAKAGAKPAKPGHTQPKPVQHPAAPAVNPFMTIEQALATSSLPPPHEALAPNPIERPALPVATAADVPGGMPDLPTTDIPMPEDLESLTPLEYMLREMNHRRNDPNRRDRMAMAAAPFVHARAGDAGKKATKEAAAKEATGAGRFGARPAPLKLIG